MGQFDVGDAVCPLKQQTMDAARTFDSRRHFDEAALAQDVLRSRPQRVMRGQPACRALGVNEVRKTRFRSSPPHRLCTYDAVKIRAIDHEKVARRGDICCLVSGENYVRSAWHKLSGP